MNTCSWDCVKRLLATSGFTLFMLAGMSGCQVNVGGQTLPSPYYLEDDLHYAPAGPEFKLSREAAAMKEYESGFEEAIP